MKRGGAPHQLLSYIPVSVLVALIGRHESRTENKSGKSGAHLNVSFSTTTVWPWVKREIRR